MLLIDNFDSFTFNLVHYFQMLGITVNVIRNNALSLAEFKQMNPKCLVIGPGPGNPNNSGISSRLIQHYDNQIPILGVCLGHQCIGSLYGGQVVKAKAPMHGKISQIVHDGLGVFRGLPQTFSVVRYHSLIVDRTSLPTCLEVSAETKEGEIMGLRHRQYQTLEGIQFHPESVKSEFGLPLLKNFINL